MQTAYITMQLFFKSISKRKVQSYLLHRVNLLQRIIYKKKKKTQENEVTEKVVTAGSFNHYYD